MIDWPRAGFLEDKKNVLYNSMEVNESDLIMPQGGTKTKLEKWETTATGVLIWPEEARALKQQYNWISRLYMLSDVVLSILPLYFIRKRSLSIIRYQL